MTSILLTPVPITKDNLDVVIQAGWVTEGRGLPRREGGHGQGLQLTRQATSGSRRGDRCDRSEASSAGAGSAPSEPGRPHLLADLLPRHAEARSVAARDRRPPARHAGRAGADLDRLRHPVRRRLPDAAQPVEPLGADRLGRRHGGRHGAGDRGAPHRSLGRLDPRPRRHDHGRDAGASSCRSYLGFDHPLIWVIALAVGLAVGAAIGLLQGAIIAYLGVPSFIVTLGGLLVWRGCAWWVTSGRTVAPMDDALHGARRRHRRRDRRQLDLGRGAARLRRHRLARAPRPPAPPAGSALPLRPVWAEVTVAGLRLPRRVRRSCWSPTAIDLPPRVAERIAAERGLTVPPQAACRFAHGLALPVLIAVVCRHRRHLPGPAHALRPLRLRHRRQSGGGRALGHRYQARHRAGLRA